MATDLALRCRSRHNQRGCKWESTTARGRRASYICPSTTYSVVAFAFVVRHKSKFAHTENTRKLEKECRAGYYGEKCMGKVYGRFSRLLAFDVKQRWGGRSLSLPQLPFLISSSHSPSFSSTDSHAEFGHEGGPHTPERWLSWPVSLLLSHSHSH